MNTGLFIKDIEEKVPGAVKAPSLPTPRPGGFPAAKNRVSKFKSQRTKKTISSSSPNTTQPLSKPTQSTPATARPSPPTTHAAERRQIDQDNANRIADMSADDIERAREELMNNMSPEVIQMLMKRAFIEDPDEHAEEFERFGDPSGKPSAPPQPPPEIKIQDTTRPPAPAQAPNPAVAASADATVTPVRQPKKKVTFAPAPSSSDPLPQDESPEAKPNKPTHPDLNHDEIAPETPVDIPFNPGSVTHFMKSSDDSSTPDPDPSDPNFLENLRLKYFPTISPTPSTLAWMSPLPTPHSAADQQSPYYPGQSSLPISALRFDFRGQLISPKKSREIPVTKGLHHHGEAPEAAGYTIGELAIYARSRVPGQRCVAFQTLGRILYRLGMGDWGYDELGKGIMGGIVEGRVMESLGEGTEAKNVSVGAYATEALWLFEKGGWKEKVKNQAI